MANEVPHGASFGRGQLGHVAPGMPKVEACRVDDYFDHPQGPVEANRFGLTLLRSFCAQNDLYWILPLSQQDHVVGVLSSSRYPHIRYEATSCPYHASTSISPPCVMVEHSAELAASDSDSD